MNDKLKKLVRRWRKGRSGGGACCQSEEISYAKQQARRECANELEALIKEAENE
jgi:hypothetical protein